MIHKWTSEVEMICERLRINCVNLSEYHRRRYYHFKSYGKYFRLPMIILASINSTASVGLQPVLKQEYISGITCLISMMMGILGAIELYMGIQSAMELELKQSKEFYSLAIDLFKTKEMKREHRGEDGKDYLNKKYGVYTKLCEASNLLKRKLTVDLLTTIPLEYVDKTRATTPTSITKDGTTKIVLIENKSWFEYVCCCFYKLDKFSSVPFTEKNLQLYTFPNQAANFDHKYNPSYEYSEETNTVDIENQYNEMKNESYRLKRNIFSSEENLNKSNSNITAIKEVEEDNLIETKEDLIETKEDLIETKEDLIETKDKLIEPEGIQNAVKTLLDDSVDNIVSKSNK